MITASAPGSFAALSATLRPFVGRRVHANDVDDVLQDILLRIHRGAPGLRNSERLGPWIYQVARNAIIDHHRARVRTINMDVDAPCHEDEDDTQALVSSLMAPFVAMLPALYRDALVLTELHGASQQSAADKLGLSLSGTKSRVQRGKRMLRKSLEDCCLWEVDRRGNIMSCEPRPDGKYPG